MPRIARTRAPGAIHHVVSNFVNDEYRMTTTYRRNYLRRMGRIAGRIDWRLLAYALMTTHLHNVAEERSDPLHSWLHPLNTGFASHVNKLEGRSGPVFTERPHETIVAPEITARVIAYVHNNPVKANVVRDPADSDWTSHRAFLGLEPAPPWLDVPRALSLCGFSSAPSGRLGFHEFVVSRIGEDDPTLTRAKLSEIRTAVREHTGAPVGIASPVLESAPTSSPECPIIAAPGTPIRRVWCGDLRRLVALVSTVSGVPEHEIVSRGRRRAVVRARRLVVLTATRFLHRNVTEAGAVVGLSANGASQLLSRAVDATEQLLPWAERIAAMLLEADHF
jgi:REP element-mobilizing transposase RayT